MSYLYIIIATIAFSFVGTLVKIASTMVPSSVVTFCRFFFGVIFLFIVCLLRRKKPNILHRNLWIWVAIIGKSINYFCENTALQLGASFGNIIIYPVQAVSLCVFSALLFHEKIGPRKIISIVLCVTGILVVSWNGLTLDMFMGDSLPVMILFIFAAIGAASFILAQKMLVDTLPATDMNFSVFMVGAVITCIPACADIPKLQAFNFPALLSLMALGAITGGAFLLVSKSLKKLSLVVSGLIQNASSILALIWAAIFWHEPITGYVIIGSMIFLLGLVLINIAPKKGIFAN